MPILFFTSFFFNMSRSTTALAIVFFLSFVCTDARASINHLVKCWEKQVGPLRDQFLVLHYSENQNTRYHSPEPWQVLPVKSQGRIYCNAENFAQSDTVTNEGKPYVSVVQFSPSELLSKPYWSTAPRPVTKSQIAHVKIENARYSPVLLLRYFLDQHPSPDSSSDATFAVYTLDINKAIVRLFIRKADFLLEKIVTIEHDGVLGDIAETILYEDFAQYEKLSYARRVRIEKIQNIHDEVMVSAVGIVSQVPSLIEKPADYSVGEDEEEVPNVSVKKMNDHLYSVQLLHAETQSLLVEFKDFFVAIDVPLSSENGELVLQEARKIAPGKPVKYYAFGHHHPWYIGGVRPFIRQGATVLCRKENISYVEYIANAPHALKPDSLYLHPRPLQTQLLDSITTITDGSFEMKIYHIGIQSAHTSDYLLFYFPSEKLVFEGDLAWIPQKGPVKKAGRTQAALYNAIKHIGIDVDTIAQTWPLGEKRSMKSVFSFSELEESANMK